MTFKEKLVRLNDLTDRFKRLSELCQYDITNSFSEETIEEKIQISSEINSLIQTLTEEEYEIYVSGVTKNFSRSC